MTICPLSVCGVGRVDGFKFSKSEMKSNQDSLASDNIPIA